MKLTSLKTINREDLKFEQRKDGVYLWVKSGMAAFAGGPADDGAAPNEIITAAASNTMTDCFTIIRVLPYYKLAKACSLDKVF